MSCIHFCGHPIVVAPVLFLLVDFLNSHSELGLSLFTLVHLFFSGHLFVLPPSAPFLSFPTSFPQALDHPSEKNYKKKTGREGTTLEQTQLRLLYDLQEPKLTVTRLISSHLFFCATHTNPCQQKLFPFLPTHQPSPPPQIYLSMRTTFVCLAALAQLALSAFAEPEPYKIPLYARSSDGGIVKAAGEELKDGVLAGKVEIGNPPQQFTLAFDTTTGYSWVRGSRCKSENCLDRCTYYARRSDSAVSTGKKFSVDYGDACVDTHVYTDTFRFAGLTVDNMPFGGAYRMSGFDTGFDGYLGLGRAVDWNETKVHSNLMRRDPMSSSAFVSNAYQSGSGLQSSQFGMYTTDSSSSGGSSGFDQSGSGTSNSGTTTGSTGTTNSGSTTGSTTGSTANGSNPPASGAVPSGAASSGAAASSGVAPAGSSAAASSGVAPAASSAAPAPSSQPASTGSTTDGGSSGVTSGGFGFQKRHNNEEEPAGYLILGTLSIR